MIESQGAKITPDVGFFPLREIDYSFKIFNPMQYAKIWENLVFFRESHANMRLMEGFGSQNGNPRGFCPGKEVPKTIF